MVNIELHIKKKYNITTFDKLKVNFWGIPKCANTTIKHILIRANDLEKFNRINKMTFKKTEHWAHNACDYISPNEARKNKFKNFTVLRNPISRTISMYKSLDKLGPNMDGSINFKKDIKRFFKHPNILSFLNILHNYPDEDRNLHFRSQKSYCLFDDIIKLDIKNIDSTIPEIHPSLIVDVHLNKITQTYNINDTIISKIYEVFKEDFKLMSESLK